jgi:Tfp pilus assembly protein FimT
VAAPPVVRREWSRRGMLICAALVLGVGALGTATTATAGSAVSTTTPFPFAGTNPCTGEPVTGTGNLHLLISDNLSTSGNVQFHIEANLSGLQAVTLTGKKYVVIDEEDLTNTFDTDGAPAHETVEVTFQLIRSGEDGTLFPDDDFYEHFLAHITANANGTVTVQDVTLDATCK